MNDFDIISAWGGQIFNYDPDTCANGGIAFNLKGELVVVEVGYKRCGEFDTKFSVNVICSTHNWKFCYETTEDSDVDDKTFSYMDENNISIDYVDELLMDEILDSIDGVLGINSWDFICEAFWAAKSITEWYTQNMEI